MYIIKNDKFNIQVKFKVPARLTQSFNLFTITTQYSILIVHIMVVITTNDASWQ
jgi:hypothetical protein